ncbi:hypothetical protein H6P81_017451 [Aristolochia fimbriata]|uniref:Bifunctional inhibitor/plant lipid transfer protein/seed storage helical domain-containing protein n=1 Tax=Aristolochia fimbriata TaxID=158543 RepID=A0AAV7E2H7_ARIFI|nr:hypothetical protein H6P81_017451 [Aristolochia fimbriata]
MGMMIDEGIGVVNGRVPRPPSCIKRPAQRNSRTSSTSAMAPAIAAAAATLACFLLSASFLSHVEAAIDCAGMKHELASCVPYLTAKVIQAPKKCCSGMRKMNKVVDTEENRKAACECMREAAGKTPALRTDRVHGINPLCETKIPNDVIVNPSCKSIL